jgi:hypothetical protein
VPVSGTATRLARPTHKVPQRSPTFLACCGRGRPRFVAILTSVLATRAQRHRVLSVRERTFLVL